MTVYHSLCSKSITSWRAPYALIRTRSKSSAIFFHGWLCCGFLQPENRYIWYSVFCTAVLKDLVMYQHNGSPHFDVCENLQATDYILCWAWQSVTKFCHQFFKRILRRQITCKQDTAGSFSLNSEVSWYTNDWRWNDCHLCQRNWICGRNQ